jgi:hypothetical protein
MQGPSRRAAAHGMLIASLIACKVRAAGPLMTSDDL